MKKIIKLLSFLKLNRLIKIILEKYGYTISNLNNPSFFDILNKVIKIYDVKLIIDIGANIGQFSKKILSLDYKEKIILVEPIRSTFIELEKQLKGNNSEKNKNLLLNNIALSTQTSKMKMYKVNRNNGKGDMNSFFKTNENSTKLIKNSNVISHEYVDAVDINEFFSNIAIEENTLIKIDTEGHDFELLKHLDKKYFQKVLGFIIEIHYVPFFENKYTDPLEITNFFKEKNFIFYGVDPTFINPPTGQLLVSDVLYINKNIQMKKVDLEFDKKIGSPRIFFQERK